MKYKVHSAYINNNGSLVSEGIYEEYELDIAEARYKSVVTLSDIELKVTSTNQDKLENINIINSSYEQGKDFNVINLEPSVSIKSIEYLKINIEPEEKLTQLKYVSKNIAKKVIIERNKKPFSTYVDLDMRVPLSFNRKWQDICAIDFKESENVKNLIEFI